MVYVSKVASYLNTAEADPRAQSQVYGHTTTT